MSLSLTRIARKKWKGNQKIPRTKSCEAVTKISKTFTKQEIKTKSLFELHYYTPNTRTVGKLDNTHQETKSKERTIAKKKNYEKVKPKFATERVEKAVPATQIQWSKPLQTWGLKTESFAQNNAKQQHERERECSPVEGYEEGGRGNRREETDCQ